MSYLQKLELSNFTAFKRLAIEFSPGVNVLVGTNGTGKTHVMKSLYAACSFKQSEQSFAEKLVGVFMPDERQIGRIVHRVRGGASAKIQVYLSSDDWISASFTTKTKQTDKVKLEVTQGWLENRPECVFIPVKEMLTHAPGFLSVYDKYELQFEDTYADIIRKAQLPPIKGRPDAWRLELLDRLRDIMDGSVYTEGEKYFHRGEQGDLEFGLLSEGVRKLALLWVLIQNGTLTSGSVLFWDEPEANVNPEQSRKIVEIVLELQRHGTQVFVATHDYTILKWFDLAKLRGDSIQYHSFWREKALDSILAESTFNYDRIQHNPILPAFDEMYKKSIGISRGDNH